MTLAERTIAWAQSQIGVTEARGDNDGIPSIRYMGGRREPWCAHFIATCFRESGFPLPHDVLPTPDVGNPLASVQFMENTFKERGWTVEDPRPGDIVFFKNRGMSDAGRGRHVGIVEKISAGNMIQTIEGNLGNKVARMVYYKTNSRISSFGRVPDVDLEKAT